VKIKTGNYQRSLLWLAESKQIHGTGIVGKRPAVTLLLATEHYPPWLSVSRYPKGTKRQTAAALVALADRGLLKRTPDGHLSVWKITAKGLTWLQDQRDRFSQSLAGGKQWRAAGPDRWRWLDVTQYGWQVLVSYSDGHWWFTMTTPTGETCGWIKSVQQTEHGARREAESTWYHYTMEVEINEESADPAPDAEPEDIPDYTGEWDVWFEAARKTNTST